MPIHRSAVRRGSHLPASLLFLSLVVAACGGSDGPTEPPKSQCVVSAVQLTPSSAQLQPGDTVRLAATVTQQNCTNTTVTWSSSNASIASVSQSGLVTGVAAGGPVTITAAVGTVSGASQVTVVLAPVASISLSASLPPERLMLQVDTLQVRAYDAQSNLLTGRAVTFSTSNPAVATVSPQGVVTPVALGGPAWIRATVEGRTDSLPVEILSLANNRLAFAWANDASSTDFYAPSGAWAFGSNGRQPRIRRVGTGVYEVVFPGLRNSGAQTETVLASAYGASSNFCKPAIWVGVGANIHATVRCYTAAGQPVDALFTVAMIGSGALAGRVGYAWLHDPASTTEYSPSGAYRFNSAGGLISAQSTATGTYTSKFAQLGRVGGSLPEVFLAVSYGGGTESCHVSSWSNAPDMSATVRCFDPAGAAVASQMVTLTVERGRTGKRHAVVWASQPAAASYTANNGYSWTSTGAVPTIVRNDVGRYLVTLPGQAKVGGAPETVIASAYGATPGRCKVVSWNNAGADMAVDVICHSLDGAPQDQMFNVLLLE